MERPISLTSFELGQLYVMISPAGLSKLSPELRKKLREAFESEKPVERPYDLAVKE